MTWLGSSLGPLVSNGPKAGANRDATARNKHRRRRKSLVLLLVALDHLVEHQGRAVDWSCP